MKVLLLGRISESRQIIHHMLAARGHDVIVTDNRDVFWAEFIRDTYPMIFLDLSIAGYPELHVCRHIRSISRDYRNLIVVYGLRGQEVHADLLIDAGVDEYLSIDSAHQEDLDNCVILFEHHAWLASIRQQASAASQSVYENLFYHLTTSPLAVIEWDRELRVVHWTQGAARLFGWKASDIVGKSVMDWPFIDEEDTARVFLDLSALVDGMEDRQSITRRATSSTGEHIITEWHTSVVRGMAGQFISAMSIVVDVTQREQLLNAAQIQERRFHALIERVSELMLVIDAENTITYLSPSVDRTLDFDSASMPGTSIFDLVHPDDHSAIREMLARLADTPGMATATTQFHMLRADGSRQHVEATATDHLDDPAIEGIILVARDISYQHVIHNGDPFGQDVERQELLADLRDALARSQLLIQYQPEVHLTTGAIVRFEALVSWQHPRRGMIYPDELLDLAGGGGLSPSIGQWALTEACRTAASWKAPQRRGDQPAVSVNVTDREFQQPHFVEMVRSALQETGLDPACLKLEVVESAIAPSDSRTILHLKQLNDLNVRITIDRFGSGYSSLDKLAQLTVETIKIDPEFVSGASNLAGSLSILRAVTSLAHSVGIDVVAEGIETMDQQVGVTSAGCDRGQGNYLYPPMSASDVQALLSEVANHA